MTELSFTCKTSVYVRESEIVEDRIILKRESKIAARQRASQGKKVDDRE